MNKKSIKINYIYNLIINFVNAVYPLITAPFLSRVLGAEGIGKVNHATSIIGWFILFSSFGIPRYGIREIAKKRDDKKKLSQTFWNLILVQAIFSIISIMIYLVAIFSIPQFSQNKSLYLLMILQVIFSIFSIDWFFQGIEEYGYITARNILFKVLSIILIFLFIRNPDDYLIYATINIFGLSFNNILNYFHAKKYVTPSIGEIRIKYYLSKLKIYFFTTLIVCIYTQLDQTLIGWFNEVDLAYYMRSKTLLGVGIGVLSSIINVLIPRIAYLAKNNYNEYRTMIKVSINYIYLFSYPCVVGLFMLSDNIMLLFGGAEFLPASKSLQIICILILINSLGSWQINQILIPNKKENVAFKIQSIGAALSFILNLILIPRFSYIGAAITWIIVEFFLFLFVAIYIRVKLKNIRIYYFTPSGIKYICSTIVMAIFIIVVKNKVYNNLLFILITVGFSPIIYFIVLLGLKDEIVLGIFKNYYSSLYNNSKLKVLRIQHK